MSAVLNRLSAALDRTYRLDRELGAGGMATVFLAHDLKHQRDVAIKVLHPDLGAALGAERFLTEIRTTARLQHPHILPLLDSGEADGLLYYVMPLVTGETLRARLERERQLPIADAVRIAREVAGALDYAHRQNVIHRDIKPENILLQDGAAVVADFGIALAVQSAGGARMTQTGLSLGTPQYTSPEQAMGERTIDARSDIYALGAVTYEMLTGDPPFTGSSVQAVVAKVMNAEPERPSLTRKAVSPSLEAAVLRSLEKLPADRYASAAEYATALTQESSATTTTRAAALSGASRRPLVTIALLAMIPAAVAGWFARGTQRGATSEVAVLRPQRLTHAGNVGCAGIAPGGQQVALVVGRYTDETLCEGALVVRPMPTGPDRVLVPSISSVSAVRWSPGGDIVLVAGAPLGKAFGVWAYPTKSGTARQLWSGPVSAAGFVDSARVYVVTFDAAPTTAVNARPLLRVLDAQSGQQSDSTRMPTARISNVTISPNTRGPILATISTTTQHMLVARDGHVSDSIRAAASSNIVWISDTAVAYHRQPDFRLGDLVMQRVDPSAGRFIGKPTVLVTGLPAVLTLSYDAATGVLAWTSSSITDELHRISLSGAPSPQLVTRSRNAYIGNPVLSPDGLRVAYAREDALGVNAYAKEIATGIEQAISSDTLGGANLYWPSAQHIVRVDGLGLLHSYDLATGRSRSYAAPQGERLAGASANSWVFLRDETHEVVVRDSLLRNPRALPPFPAVPANGTGAVSPDGRFIAVSGVNASGRLAFTAYSMESASWSAPTVTDSLPRRLTNITNDGTAYFTRFSGHTEMWSAKIGGPMTRLAMPSVQCYEGSVTVNARGDAVLCNLTSNFPDAYMVTLPGAKR